jgi:hypothetical protein
MDRSRFGLRLLQGAGLFLLAIAAFCGLLFLRGPWCWDCRGRGAIVERDSERICPECSGTGLGRHLSLYLYRTMGFCIRQDDGPWRLILARNGVKLWEGDPIALPVLGWLGAGVVTFIGLVVGLRGGVCPLCAGEGTFLLEVEPPGRPAKVREVSCPACEGQGNLTRLDRWLAGV